MYLCSADCTLLSVVVMSTFWYPLKFLNLDSSEEIPVIPIHLSNTLQFGCPLLNYVSQHGRNTALPRDLDDC